MIMAGAATWSHSDYIALANVIGSIAVGAAVIFATFFGPIKAARGADARAAAAARREDRMRVFRMLMAHRYDVTHRDFVMGLNMVPIEFQDSADCKAAFSAYLDAYHARNTDREDCALIRKNATIRLLTAVGSELGYELEQLDLMEQVYAPKGWSDDVEKGAKIASLLTDIADGKRAFPVFTVVAPNLLQQGAEGALALRVTAVENG